MEWSLLYTADNVPKQEEIDEYVGSKFWHGLRKWLQETYGVSPKMGYSKCAGAPGWNIKYQKSGRSLCTLYPMQGFFIALVVIGNRELNEAELAMPACSAYTRDLFLKTRFACGGKWLMMQIKDEDVLEDAKSLIRLRAQPK